MLLGTVEKDASGLFGSFDSEPVRGYVVLEKLLETIEFQTVLDVGAGSLEHANLFLRAGKIVDTVDFGLSEYSNRQREATGIRNSYIGDFNTLDIPHKYDVVWCSHVLEHQVNPNLFLKKIREVANDGGYVDDTSLSLFHESASESLAHAEGTFQVGI